MRGTRRILRLLAVVLGRHRLHQHAVGMITSGLLGIILHSARQYVAHQLIRDYPDYRNRPSSPSARYQDYPPRVANDGPPPPRSYRCVVHAHRPELVLKCPAGDVLTVLLREMGLLSTRMGKMAMHLCLMGCRLLVPPVAQETILLLAVATLLNQFLTGVLEIWRHCSSSRCDVVI